MLNDMLKHAFDWFAKAFLVVTQPFLVSEKEAFSEFDAISQPGSGSTQVCEGPQPFPTGAFLG
jgi:hypothetical protein